MSRGRLLAVTFLSALFLSPGDASPQAQGEYDAGVQRVQEYLRKEDLGSAENLLREMLSQYPDNPELLSLQVRIFFWKKEYEKALPLLERLTRLSPHDIELESLYLESLILTGDTAGARRELEGMPEDTRDALYRTREDLVYRVKRNSVTLRGAYSAYTRDREDEKGGEIELSYTLGEVTVLSRYTSLQRFGISDDQFGVELYSPFGTGTKRWGYVSATASRDAEFLPQWTIGGAIYQGWRSAEFSLGYTHMEFTDDAVDMFIPGVTLYLPSGFSLEEKLYFVSQNGSYSLLSTLNYAPDHRMKVFYSFAFGNAAERVGVLQDIQKVTTLSHRLGLEYRFTPSMSIGAEGSYTHRDTLYDTRGLALFVRHWW